MIPALPPRPRNRLAETILRALHDPAARRELTALSAGTSRWQWLAEDEASWAGPLAERARAACAALAGQPLLAPEAGVRGALEGAATLFDAGLYYEVHELLEPHWAAAHGETRAALQGLIQVAVGWQHLANGNPAGARSLLVEGGGRLHGARLPGLALDDFARAAVDAAAAIAAGTPVGPPSFPRA
ncbi:MAG TPA: DUF309 domain-containing protein [Methylomirabilota bacterium]|nr:DUF309 domain-containing protein [Methylomirabilota bacterium]